MSLRQKMHWHFSLPFETHRDSGSILARNQALTEVLKSKRRVLNMMKIQEVKLKNNLSTVFINAPDATMGCVQIWFKAGSALETESEQGIAHFLEHMFFKECSAKRGTTLVKEVESYGGEINAFTSFDYTCYYINSPRDYLWDSVRILLSMISVKSFTNKNLLSEREVVYEEFLRSQDAPTQFAFSKLQEQCFTGKYAHSILGREQTIKNFNREQLTEFRNQYYNCTNALLIVAGDLNRAYKKQPLVDKLLSYIGDFNIPRGPHSSFSPFVLKKAHTLGVHTKDVNMSQLTIAFQSLPFLHPKAGIEDLALNCLGYGETSRLYRELVHRTSLANNCYSSSMYLANGGINTIKISAPAENLERIYPLLLKIIEESISSEFSEAEITKIKNQYLAAKIYEKESLEAYSFSLGNSYVQTGDLYGENNFIEKIRLSTISAVNGSLPEILQRPIHMVLQIPKKENKSSHQEELRKFQEKYKKLLEKITAEKVSNIKVSAQKTLKSVTAVDKISPDILLTKLKIKGKNSSISYYSKHDSNAQTIKLIPGVKLLYRQNLLTPTFVFHAYLKGGLAHETELNNGYHYLISEVISKGHSNIPFQKLQRLLEQKSASLDGLCGKNAYGLTMHAQSEHFSELMEHFFGSWNHANFYRKEIIHERKMIYRLMENQKKDPVKECFKQVNAIMFPGHPYSREIEGNKKSLSRVNQNELKRVHAGNLNDREMLFTYCGDLELEAVIKTIIPYLKDYHSRISTKVDIKTKGSWGKNIFIPFDREQTQIFIGLPTFDMLNSQDIYLKILSAYLAGQSSELFVRMRDQLGLCYTVGPVHFSALNGGYFGIYMASSNEKAAQAVKELNKLLNKIKEKGISAVEFARTQKMIDGQMQINLQSNEDYANAYSIPELHGLGMDFIYDNNQRIKKAQFQDFNRFITKFFEQEWNLVMVGKESVE